MKLKEVNYSKSGVISKAAYENLRPFFSVTVEPEDGENIDEIFEKLKDTVNRQFAMEEYKAKIDLVEKQFSSLRLYVIEEKNIKYPSITSVLGWDKEWYIPEGRLLQYQARGTIIHTLFEDTLQNFQKTGKIVWKNPEEMPELQKEVGILKQGDLGLSWNDCSYKKFGEIYFKDIGEVRAMEQKVINHELKCAGTLDLVAPFQGKLSLIDLKTGDYDWRQPAFYVITYEVEHNVEIEQMVIFPIGATNNKSGYKKPIIRDREAIHEEFKEMVKARQAFKERFGI